MARRSYMLLLLFFCSSPALAGIPIGVPEIDGGGVVVALALLGAAIAFVKDRSGRKK